MLSVFDFIDVKGKFSSWADDCINNKKPLDEVVPIPKDKILWLDSGGYELAHLRRPEWYSPKTVFQFQLLSGCDVSCILDIPFNRSTNRGQVNKLIDMNLEFAKSTSVAATPTTCLMAVVHGTDQTSMIEYTGKILATAKPHVLAVPWRDLKALGYQEAFLTLRTLSKLVKGQSKLHVLAAGSVTEWPFIYACGVDTIDSTTWAHKILDPKTLVWKNPTTTLGMVCSCSVCSSHTSHALSRDPLKEACVYNHNLAVMNERIHTISGALVDGSISNLAKQSDPKLFNDHAASIFEGDAQ